jgi:phytoene dehydrogenase-like protein
MRQLTHLDAVVVGGGLAGLTAATLVAESGQRVALFERADIFGGRAITNIKSGFHLNLGPHAWGPGGAGTRVLSTLGINLTGRAPRPVGAFALRDDRLHTLPIGFVSLLTTDLLSLNGKLEFARLLARLPRLDTSPFDTQTIERWLHNEIHDEQAREVVNMFIRVAMYANAPGVMSAGTSLASLQSVLRDNVWYLDGGWQSIVDALQRKASAVGVQLIRDTPVREVLRNGAVRGVRLDDGQEVLARSVVLAVSPAVVRSLVPGLSAGVLASWDGVAAKAACLDIGLAQLPKPRNIVAFGIDRPLYFSVHSATAALAPGNAAVIHAAKYLDPMGATDAKGDEKELEEFVDILQPGWRAEVVVQRFLPAMTVINAIPSASRGGLEGRASVDVGEVPGLYVAGDWVGREGTLASGAVASAAHAARLAIDRARRSSPSLDAGAVA